MRTFYPTEELFALADLHAGKSLLVIRLQERCSTTEAISDDLDLISVRSEDGHHLFASEAAEHDRLVLVIAKPGDLTVARSGRAFKHAKIHHPIETIFAQSVVRLVPGGEVIEAIFVHDGNGRYHMRLALRTSIWFAIEADLSVGEFDLALGLDSLMDGIDSMKNTAILRFDAPRDMDASIEQMLFVVGSKLLDIGDERLCLFFGYRATRLDGIDHEHKLSDGEIPSLDRVFNGIALVGLDIDIEFTQDVQIGIDALALCGNAVGIQAFDDLRHGEPVFGVGLFLEDLQKV